MEEREKRRKILYIVLGVIVLILLFFVLKSCSSSETKDNDELAITSVDLAKSSTVLTVGEEEKLSYAIIPANTNEGTRWITNNSSVATVDNYGNVKAISTGTAIITLVSDKGVSDYTVVRVVSKRAEDGSHVTATITEKDVEIKVGSTKKLNYELDPMDSKYIEVMWESSSPLVATVSSDGIVTGLKSGVTSITAKIVLSDNSVITDTTTVTVSENASLYLTTNVPDLRLGEVVRLSAAISTTDVILTDGTVKVSKDNIASISNVSISDGYLTFDVKGLKAGDVTLKLTGITSDGKTLNLDVPVTVVKFSELFISSGNKEIKVGDSFVLSGRLEPSIDGAMDVECKSSNEKSVTVESRNPSGEYNGACQITGVKAGSSTITMVISGQKKIIKVTVKEDGTVTPDDPNTPDNPDKPDTPDTPDTPDKPDNPDNPTGTASLSVSLDKTSYSINDKAVITVKFTDENGNTKTLSENEYTVATEFDSSSLGTKKLIVVYPYKDSSLKAEVEYTIAGGSTPGTTTTPGSGGYNSGSGGGGSTGSGGRTAGVYNGTSIVELTKNNKKNSDGNYEDKVEVVVKEQGWDTNNFDNVLVSFKCKVSEERCKKATHADMWDSSIFEVQDVQIVDKGTTTNISGSYTVIYKNQKGTWKQKNTYYDKNDPNFEAAIKENVFLGSDHAVNNATGLNPVLDSEGNQITIIDGDGHSTIDPSDDKAGTLTITPEKAYKRLATDAANFVINLSINRGYKLLSITPSTQIAPDTYYYNYTVSSKNETLTVTAALLNNETKKIVTLEASASVKIDSVKPNCNHISYDSQTNRINIIGIDNESGLADIKAVKWGSVGNSILVSSTEKSINRFYTAKMGGNISFIITDNAGNTNTCTVNVPTKFCYTYAACGSENVNNCKACKEAGCKKDGEKVAGLYECTAKNTDVKSKKYIYHILDKTETELWTTKENDRPKKYEYEFEKLDNVTIDSVIYSCTPQKDGHNFGLFVGKYSAYACIDESQNNISYNEINRKDDEDIYNKNCLVCGCDKWTDWYPTYREYTGNVTPEYNSDYLQVIKVRKSYSSSSDACSQTGNMESEAESTFFCNSIANGSKINGKIINCN